MKQDDTPSDDCSDEIDDESAVENLDIEVSDEDQEPESEHHDQFDVKVIEEEQTISECSPASNPMSVKDCK